MKTAKQKTKKRRLYECAYFDYEYDDLSRFCWCHSPKNVHRECMVELNVCKDLCPFFKRKSNKDYVLIEDNKHCQEVREMFIEKLKEEAEEAAKEAEKALREASKKAVYAQCIHRKVKNSKKGI